MVLKDWFKNVPLSNQCFSITSIAVRGLFVVAAPTERKAWQGKEEMLLISRALELLHS
jgi:hypothetical protein